MPQHITAASFKSIEGELVQLKNDQIETEARIIEVAKINKYESQNRDPFSILFLIENQSVFSQQTCTFSHHSMEDFDIFIVPIGQDEKGTRYEAIFN